ncbi:D-alanine--D-alanine ligase [Pilimelia terevasa]|uniref:D-alanine--D-alanine ligase n=1 Tax=Pilimelia terevasa TaxID=53372 RepID=A0A8J3FK03_9ACTN|nr:D-alanine--D-alanine ligase [Pilimelia terevasa]GGK41482.1 D-alanine--D-alanine ligase [Pilimelia terevasa]
MTEARALRVLVLAGGLSYEREVSLRSGRRAVDALRGAGVDATLRDADAALLPALDADPPDAVLVALHGASGEDGSLRAVLDLVGLPYLGADARAARLAWDKPSAKSVLRTAGVPTPDWVTLPQERFTELGGEAVLQRVTAGLGLPLIVKPAQGGSGLGVSRVSSAVDLPAAMVTACGYYPTALVERYAVGADVAVSVIDDGGGPRALTPVEIAPHAGVYDYAARYTAGLTTWHAPARLADEVLDSVRALAVRAHTTLGLRDLSRVDLIVSPDGAAQVLDVNVAPGLTETSLLPMAAHAEGLDLGKLLAALLRHRIAA